MNKTSKAFHGKKEEKDFYVSRLREHRRLEHLTQGVGFKQNGKEVHACAIGCLFEKYDHSLAPKLIGVPEWLARLADHLFEKLSAKDANKFAIDWVAAIPVGANLEPVKHHLAIARIGASLVRLEPNKEPYAAECRNALNLVRAWHQGMLSNTPGMSESARSAAESAARSARSAAWSAAESAESAAASAARSAAWSAESAARSAAWSAASAAASAESAYYQWEAKTLINLIKKSKP